MPGALTILQTLLLGKNPLQVLIFISLLLSPNLAQIHLTESKPPVHNLAASEVGKVNIWHLGSFNWAFTIPNSRLGIQQGTKSPSLYNLYPMGVVGSSQTTEINTLRKLTQWEILQKEEVQILHV